MQFNINNCFRDTVAKAYLFPILNCSSLTLSPKTYVTRILFKRRRAIGVEYSRGGKLYRSFAKKEVILAAGAVGSPALLLRSGVGDASDLEKLGIPVVKNLPVGKFYQDHTGFSGLNINTNITRQVKTRRQLLEEFYSGFGEYCLPSFEAHSYFTTRFARDTNYPDMELLMRPNSPSEIGQRISGYTLETINALRQGGNSFGSFNLFIINQQPKSFGNVSLNSSDPYEFPLINTNSFSDPDDYDINAMVEYVKIAVSLLETEAFKKLNATLQRIELPGCKQFEYFSDDHIKCTVRHLSSTSFFPVGTCKMGSEVDPTAVVNENCLVHGLKRLRVVDPSVYPFTISGHSAASAMAFAESVADLIKIKYDISQC